eukprot:TRINITY_DN1903_c0_g1_i1.p3 TRINITY_DN1903_c0_g1~~TRINITY_DN1903_c0_g1_i1.p3  ORF type:complete len:205 (-),score=51.22 TRINITY_DN1903_c0_g1_i1:32-646(-)
MPRVLLVRHAEGVHNVAARLHGEGVLRDPVYFDPELTATGWEQAAAAGREHAGVLREASLVVVSPLSRTIQTAEAMLRAALPGGQAWPRIVAVETVRERLGIHEPDHRRPVSELRARFPSVDFGLVTSEADALWDAEVREPAEALAARAASAVAWLGGRAEAVVVVVSHHDFLEALWPLVAERQVPRRSEPAEFRNCEGRQAKL